MFGKYARQGCRGSIAERLMKKIVIIRRNFRFDGGAERSVSCFLDVYRALGYEVSLLCESWSGPCADDIEIVSFDLKGSRAQKAAQFVQKTQEFMVNHRHSVYQSHEWVPSSDIVRLGDGLHSYWVKQLSRCRASWWALGSLFFDSFHRGRLRQERLTLMHPHLRKIIVNSEFVRQQVLDSYPTVSEKIVVVRNAIPQSFFASSQSNRRVVDPDQAQSFRMLFVGSGWERKGLAHAIKILAALGEQYSLAVIGQDKKANKYFRLARRMGVSSRIKFLGAITMTEEVYKSYHGLLLPTLYDPFPNVICEALVSGLPVYCSDSCGAVDFEGFDGVNICRSDDEYEQAIRNSDTVPQADYFKTVFSADSVMKQIRDLFQ